MRITVKVGILFAIGWILVKLSMFGIGVKDAFIPGALINMLFVVLAITVGLYLQKRKDIDEGNTLRDIKNGMTAGIPYTIIISVFIYFYYSKIDPEYNKHQIAEKEISLDKNLNDSELFNKIKESNPDFEVMTKKQIKKAEMQKFRDIYNPKSSAIMALSSMLMYVTLNSVLITVIFRKIVFRNQR